MSSEPIEGIKKKKPEDTQNNLTNAPSEITDQDTQTETTLPEAPNLTELIQQDLQEKLDQGLDLSAKAIYVPILKEIECKRICSYGQVHKTWKKFVKVKKDTKKEVQSEGSKITIKPVDAGTRPPRQEPSKDDSQQSKPPFPSQTDTTKEDIEINTMFVELAFENIAAFEKMVGIPAPQAAKIKKIAKAIGVYNTKMIAAGHPEKVIDVSDKLLKFMLYAGIVGMFAEPIARKWTTHNDENGITKKSKEEL